MPHTNAATKQHKPGLSAWLPARKACQAVLLLVHHLHKAAAAMQAVALLLAVMFGGRYSGAALFSTAVSRITGIIGGMIVYLLVSLIIFPSTGSELVSLQPCQCLLWCVRHMPCLAVLVLLSLLHHWK